MARLSPSPSSVSLGSVASTIRAESKHASVNQENENSGNRLSFLQLAYRRSLRRDPSNLDLGCSKSLRDFVESKHFGAVVHFMTFVSAVELGIPDVADGEYEDARVITDNVVTAVFLCELLLKVAAYKFQYFLVSWNVLDAIVTVMSVLDEWIVPRQRNQSVEFGSVKVFRIFRICRIFRFVGSVPELRVLMESLISSVYALVWIVLLLVLLLYAFAIVCIELIGSDEDSYPGFNRDSEKSLSTGVERWNNFEYFGTLPRSMMTLFNVAMVADWSPLRPILEFQVWCLPLLLFVICITSFAIVNVIMGVIMERTSRNLQESYRQEVNVLKCKQMDCLTSMAERMLSQHDLNSDGALSMREMATLNISGIDLLSGVDFPKGFTTDDLFVMLNADGDETISKAEFVNGMHRLIFSNDFQKTCLEQLGQGHLRRMHVEMRQSLDQKFGDLNARVDAIFSEFLEIKSLLEVSPPLPAHGVEPPPVSCARDREVVSKARADSGEEGGCEALGALELVGLSAREVSRGTDAARRAALRAKDASSGSTGSGPAVAFSAAVHEVAPEPAKAGGNLLVARCEPNCVDSVLDPVSPDQLSVIEEPGLDRFRNALQRAPRSGACVLQRASSTNRAVTL